MLEQQGKSDVKSLKPLLLISVSLIVLSATALPRAGARDAEPVLRAYVSDLCIVADEPFYLPESDNLFIARPFLGTGLLIRQLAQAMIFGVVRGSIGRISAGAARQDTQYILAKDINLYFADLADSPRLSLNEQLGCVTIVAGQFESDRIDCTSAYIPRLISEDMAARPETEWTSARSNNSAENILKRANVCLDGPALSVYEARFMYSDDRTAFRLLSAGYWINALLSTTRKRAFRHLIYTFEIHEPSRRGHATLLTAAWINVGQVSAGASSTDVRDVDRSDWLQVPQISRATMQAYDRDTAIHQDVFGQIEALERSLVRNKRVLAGIKKRRDTARPDLKTKLHEEVTSIEFRILRSEAILDASRDEYAALSQARRQYMPVTIEIGVTETRSERKATMVLGQFLKSNRELIAASAAGLVALPRSVSSTDDHLGVARSDYYDALVVLEATPADEPELYGDAERQLVLAKQRYNAARSLAAIDPFE